MKNMYLAVAMAVSLAFTACSDDESGKADRAYNPIMRLMFRIPVLSAQTGELTTVSESLWTDRRVVMQSILISIFSIVKTMAMHSVL